MIEKPVPELKAGDDASDLYWYNFYRSAGDTRTFKQNRHAVQWDDRPYYDDHLKPISGRERVMCNALCPEHGYPQSTARVYCPTCDKYLCLVCHYLLHLTEEGA